MKSIGVIWAQYGPYHFARVAALKELIGATRVHAIELANLTHDYRWSRSGASLDLITLCPNSTTEKLSFWEVFSRTRLKLSELGIEVCFLPSYSPKQSLAAFLAAKSLGVRTVMMNESHAGTARAKGISTLIKRGLVSLFDAAFVGGEPHRHYFASLGFSKERIFTGYDAVDNDFFAQRADAVRGEAKEFRQRYGLPERYFLSLGRFVEKKNLTTLIYAYQQFLLASASQHTHLVMVGSGEDEPVLRGLCAQLRLPVYDKTSVHHSNVGNENAPAGVHFYGFRQIDENPIFYALADAFVLPSLYEEWGLVVNEAMAAGLPVIVSETAGCAEDLLERGFSGASADEEARTLQLNLELQRHRNGFSFDPTSIPELARILVLLESSPVMRAAMAKASREIVERFSCRNFAINALAAANTARGQTIYTPAGLQTSSSRVS